MHNVLSCRYAVRALSELFRDDKIPFPGIHVQDSSLIRNIDQKHLIAIFADQVAQGGQKEQVADEG